MDKDLIPQPSRRPEGLEMDYNTWTLGFQDGQREIVRATLGIEARNGADASHVMTSLLDLFSLENGPKVVERGGVVSQTVSSQELFFAYWENREDYRKWLSSMPVRDFFESGDALDGDVGRWRETGFIPLTHHETNYSHDQELTGLAKLDVTERVSCEIFGYWGAARDRIPASAHEELDSYGKIELSGREPLGSYVKVKPAGNLCVIRTSQDWVGSKKEHTDWYLKEVEPVLHAGVKYLQKSRKNSGAIATRYIREADIDGAPVERTCVLGYFDSLKSLEEWTHNHPTHLAIFESGLTMVRQFGGELGVRLFHEISVFPEGTFDAEYSNCSKSVGLLQGQ